MRCHVPKRLTVPFSLGTICIRHSTTCRPTREATAKRRRRVARGKTLLATLHKQKSNYINLRGKPYKIDTISTSKVGRKQRLRWKFQWQVNYYWNFILSQLISV